MFKHHHAHASTTTNAGTMPPAQTASENTDIASSWVGCQQATRPTTLAAAALAAEVDAAADRPAPLHLLRLYLLLQATSVG